VRGEGEEEGRRKCEFFEILMVGTFCNSFFEFFFTERKSRSISKACLWQQRQRHSKTWGLPGAMPGMPGPRRGAHQAHLGQGAAPTESYLTLRSSFCCCFYQPRQKKGEVKKNAPAKFFFPLSHHRIIMSTKPPSSSSSPALSPSNKRKADNDHDAAAGPSSSSSALKKDAPDSRRLASLVARTTAHLVIAGGQTAVLEAEARGAAFEALVTEKYAGFFCSFFAQTATSTFIILLCKAIFGMEDCY